MDPSTKQALFEVIKAARHRVKETVASERSEATNKEYEREYTRLAGQSGPSAAGIWSAACDTRSKRTYQRRKAALKWGIQKQLERRLWQQDLFQKAGDWALWGDTVKDISELLELSSHIEDASGTCPLTAPKRRRSKRADLPKLPQGWREELSRQFAGSSYESAYLVMALTGCRPAELESGVVVCWDGSEVTFTIRGAKVKEQQGQPLRTVSYQLLEPSHPLLARMFELLQPRANVHFTINAGKVAFTSAMRRSGKRAWPNLRVETTPYLLRHALASDWKNLRRWDDDQISSMLGHCVSKTSSTYGLPQLGSQDGLCPSTIWAARPVRDNRARLPSLPTKTTLAP